jgi:hypothetical protein
MRKTTRNIAIMSASLISAAIGASCFAPMVHAAEPSLDDLLNLPVKPGAGKPGTDTKTPDAVTPAPPGQPAIPLNPEVKKRLTEKEVSDLYRAALADMRVAAERLSDKRDPGADTQNAQQEAIDKLARLITDLERQQQSNSKSKPKSGDPKEGPQQQGDKGSEGNSGKPGSGQSAGGGQGKGEKKPGQDGKKGDEPGKKTDDGKTDPGQITNPGGLAPNDGSTVPPGGAIAGGTPTTPLEEAKANWGNLPPRVRDELIEGIGEKFSPVYREMTESYYKRLAEEKK